MVHFEVEAKLCTVSIYVSQLESNEVTDKTLRQFSKEGK